MRKFITILLILVISAVLIFAVGCSAAKYQLNQNDPVSLTQGLPSGGSIANSEKPVANSSTKQPTEEQLIEQFKNDILHMFKAWQAKDTASFRQELALGFDGALLDKKVGEAAPFISSGQGADVNNINYLNIKVVSLTQGKATINCELSYAGYEFNPSNALRGTKFAPVKQTNIYILEQKGERWLIVDETKPTEGL